MLISDFLQGIGNPVQFYPDLVPIAGSHNAVVFLCQICYWTGKERKSDGWIYKTQEEWQIETELSPKEQRNARALLKDRGLIEDKLVGIPRHLEYRLCKQALDKAWEMWLPAMRIKERLKDKLREEATLLKHGICDPQVLETTNLLRKALALARSNPEMAESIEKSISDQTAQQANPKRHSKQIPNGTASKSQTAQQAVTNEDSYIYTEITPEITSETTSENTPLTPQRGELTNKDDEVSKLSHEKPTAANSSKSKKRRSRSEPPSASRSTSDPHDCESLRHVYNEYKPSLWATCQALHDKRIKALKKLQDNFGDQTIGLLIDALSFAAIDPWWSSKNLGIDTLLRDGRVSELAEKYREQKGDKDAIKKADIQNTLDAIADL